MTVVAGLMPAVKFILAIILAGTVVVMTDKKLLGLLIFVWILIFFFR